MKFTVFAAFLFSIGWMSVVETDDGLLASCCLEVSKTRIPADNILNFTIQDQLPCSIRAIRFQTIKNKIICSDPNDDWAKKVMEIVKRRKITKHPPKPTTCYISTTNLIPTTVTTDETSESETKTSTSTTVTPGVMTIITPEMKTSTSTTVTPGVMTIITPEMKTSTSTTVTPGVMTIITPEMKTSTSTTVTPAVTTIVTSETKTSTSTTVTPAVTTVKTSRPGTMISKTTTLPSSVSKKEPESTVSCGTSETTTPPETKPKTSVGTVTPLNTFAATNNPAHHNAPKRTKPSKLKMKILRKNSKKGLRKVQINLKNKNK